MRGEGGVFWWGEGVLSTGGDRGGGGVKEYGVGRGVGGVFWWGEGC